MAILVTGKGDKVFVDDEDLPSLSKSNWHISKGYVVRNIWVEGKGRRLSYIHREIMGLQRSDPSKVDHINGNPLDNRKENLRVCTNSQNLMNRGRPRSNTSGMKGVSWDKRENKWRATIIKDQKQRFLGYFRNPEEAYEVYCLAADMLHGEFANHGSSYGNQVDR